ncbi:MAG: HAD hydrolase-like protein [Oscillospiraceae bacterium]|nr:HAD hydrolase-like protein [Oscillospiraceae bacterium]
MRYPCLVFDHDDTVVNSTATIHHPCFQDYLDRYFPGKRCTLEDYFLKNFAPGFLPMCREEYGMTDEDLEEEGRFWRAYVQEHIPLAYPGVREIMLRHKAAGGMLCVVSHSFADNIRRDYAANGLPEPDAVFGWEQPPERRKPQPWPLEEIMRRFGLAPGELLMIDDLKPGYDMAAACGVDFAGVGWSNDIPEIERFMRRNCERYFKTVPELAAFLAGPDAERS